MYYFLTLPENPMLNQVEFEHLISGMEWNSIPYLFFTVFVLAEF